MSAYSTRREAIQCVIMGRIDVMIDADSDDYDLEGMAREVLAETAGGWDQRPEFTDDATFWAAADRYRRTP